MLKSSADWLLEPQYKGIIVMDPDGWDRKNYDESWAELIDQETFDSRLMNSTCLWQGPLTASAPTCL